MFGSASTAARVNAEFRSERNRSSLLDRAVHRPMTAVSALTGATLKMAKDRLGHKVTISASPRPTTQMVRTSFTADHHKPPGRVKYSPAPDAPIATNYPQAGGHVQKSNDFQNINLSLQGAKRMDTGYKNIPPRQCTN